MEVPYRPRRFVWCRFPFMEAPLRPGPKERVAYLADIRQIAGKSHLTAMAIYTTTTRWAPDIPLPFGVLIVEPALAAAMDQKSFVLDARKIAFIPINRAYFPRLGVPSQGIVHMASPRFHQQVQNALVQLAGRPELIVRLGPDAKG